MHSLIITVISISLMAYVLNFGVNHINYDLYDEKIKENTLSSEFYNYSTSIKTYKKTFNIYPNTHNWENELKKTKVLLPDNSDGKFEYRYDIANNTVAVCFQDVVMDYQYAGVLEFHNQGLTVIGENCYARTDEALTPDAGGQVTYALTMWIKK